ncbi:MAG: sugar nucleotide-binding protein, partial [Gemmataceae bacterium]
LKAFGSRDPTGSAVRADALPVGSRLLYISSTSVYGQTDGAWIDETSPTEPLEESGRVILEAEQTLRQFRPDAVVLRFAGIYGPGRVLRKASLLKGEPVPGDPDRFINLIHVDDG